MARSPLPGRHGGRTPRWTVEAASLLARKLPPRFAAREPSPGERVSVPATLWSRRSELCARNVCGAAPAAGLGDREHRGSCLAARRLPCSSDRREPCEPAQHPHARRGGAARDPGGLGGEHGLQGVPARWQRCRRGRGASHAASAAPHSMAPSRGGHLPLGAARRDRVRARVVSAPGARALRCVRGDAQRGGRRAPRERACRARCAAAPARAAEGAA